MGNAASIDSRIDKETAKTLAEGKWDEAYEAKFDELAVDGTISKEEAMTYITGSKVPKLYYTSTSCGAANFMAAKASGLNWEAEQVDIGTHRTLVGDVDFYTINPKGNVPCIVLEDGTVLNENVATLSFIGMQGDNNALYPNDAIQRAKINNALSYIASEWHKSLGALFNPTLTEEVKAFYTAAIASKLKYMNDDLLNGKSFVAGGDSISVADFYLYVTLTWTAYLQVDISGYPNVASYFASIGEHAAIKSGLEAIATNPTHTN